MHPESHQVELDFDRIAGLAEEGWDHNSHYHGFLLGQLPAASPADALEIGCGTGSFARLLAQRYRHVLGLDLSAAMIKTARTCSRGTANIDFERADAAACPLPEAHYGCAVSIATLHHLPLASMLARMKNALQPGGILLVLDLYRVETPADFAAGAAAVPIAFVLRLLKTGRFRESEAVRAVWRAHARTDHYPALAEVRRVCEAVLPGARLKRHLLWRYSIVWKKESGQKQIKGFYQAELMSKQQPRF